VSLRFQAAIQQYVIGGLSNEMRAKVCADTVKRLIGVKLAEWLDNEANLEKWEAGKLTASERRILLTIWVPSPLRLPSSCRQLSCYCLRCE
jgi:hypothetical protein